MKKIYIFFLFVLCSFVVVAQSSEKSLFKVMCYNVENYFDCVDDSLTNDSEYLPGGMRGWNYQKYQTKQANISKVIAAIGGWDAPALVGMCEIESRKSLLDLILYSGLKNLKYKFIHHESPDARGIDVALLYQSDQFEPIHDEPIRISFPGSNQRTTRDILYVSGLVPTGDTLHVFVCHYPSRLGGELESEDKRMFVSSVLRQRVDSIFAINLEANIVVMGDFNDHPHNRSMAEVLKAVEPEGMFEYRQLYNLMFRIQNMGKGSHKHEGEWGALDQIVVSGNLLQTSQPFYTLPQDAHVFEAEFLLEDDDKYLGKKPFRTYHGMKYQGGFSDHLPVYVDFWY